MQLEESIAREIAEIIKGQLGPLREKLVALEATNAILRGSVTDLTTRLARMEVVLENKSVRVIRGAA